MEYVMKYFSLKELVDPKTYNTFGEDAWKFFREKALRALDDLREFFDRPIIVNDWASGGNYQWRGYRPKDCPVGAANSQHKLGNAFDCTIIGFDAHAARRIILTNADHRLLLNINRLEDDVSWVHFDCAELKPPQERIVVFKP